MRIITFDVKKHTDKKLVIYGEGDLKYITTYCLDKAGVKGYYYANKNGGFQSPYNNMSLEELGNLTPNVRILLAVTVLDYGILMELEAVGIDEVYSVRELWENTDFESENHASRYIELFQNREDIFFYEDRVCYSNKVMLKSIDAMVTERCSLKCESCSNLMQYYQCPQHMDINVLIESLERMLRWIDQVLELRILGGEPFMNAEFVNIIERFADSPKVKKIVIFSNATIFPKGDILQCLKHSKVKMSISDYGKLSRNLSCWTEWCKHNNVRCDVKVMDVWQDCGKLERHDYTEYELKDIFSNCDCRDLPTIIGDKLYGCQYIANAANLGAMYEEEMRKDYFIIDDSMAGDEINEFLYNRDYWEGCRYCKGRNAKRANIAPCIQTKTALHYEKLIDVPYTYNEPKREKVKEDALISVIIPVYNAEQYIERCLDSIMRQTYSNLEIIVVDDGSSDASVAICNNCKKRDELGRIRLIQNQHSGVVVARNTGIEYASGEYMTFVDADDYIDDYYLEKMKSHMDDCDVVIGNFVSCKQSDIKDKRNIFTKGGYCIEKNDIPPALYEGKEIITILINSYLYLGINNVTPNIWGKLYKTRIVKSIYRMVDTRLWFAEDTLFFRVYLSVCKKVKLVDEYGYMYTLHDSNDNGKRYQWEDYHENIKCLMECYKKAFKGHSYERDLIEAVEKDYLYRMNDAAKKNVSYSARQYKYYYPFYGRLNGKRIILYGAGNVGKWYYTELKKDSKAILMAWIDKNAEYLKENEFLPVKGIEYLDSLQEQDYDYIIIAVFDEPIYEKIRTELTMRGIPENKIIWNPTRVE